MSALTEIHTAIAGIAETLGSAVVRVGRGSGIVVADGQVLTNAHNLHDPVTVELADGSRQDGQIHAADLVGDLAVITTATDGITPVTFAAASPSLGQPVVALARPRHRGLVATFGTVSSVDTRFRGPDGRIIGDAFEHSARLPRGASGGPVATADGQVIGIDTHRRRDGFYAAIATAGHAAAIEGLQAGVAPTRPRMGVAVAPSAVAARLREAVGLPAIEGVLVREVDEDGAAARAGIKAGDLLTSIDGTSISSPADLQAALTGDAVTVSLVRGAEELTLDVTFPV